MVVDEALTTGRFLKYNIGRYSALLRSDAIGKVRDLIGLMLQLKQRTSSIRTNPAKQSNNRSKAASSACHGTTVLTSSESRSKKRQRPNDPTFGDSPLRSTVSPASPMACKVDKDPMPVISPQEAIERLNVFTQGAESHFMNATAFKTMTP
jgi:hypothetical protein